ncbi:unnamed protein product [Allacma fusca]|uniref:Uncharacterized protein n=1 Tax=Allacma fusca TaxID=39272 RepID=A0A8J2JSV0_9HEXA|nr:unnamed protein product [Allacma fusca]
MKCTILCLIVFVYFVETYGEKTCKQLVSDITKRQLGGISKCTKSMKFKNGKDKSQKMGCILKCVMVKEGFLDAEGRMPKEQFDKFIEKELSPSLKERGLTLFDSCRASHADNLDPSEEFCKSYDPLVKCMLGAMTQLCPS